MVVALRYLLIVGLIGFVALGVGPAVWDAIWEDPRGYLFTTDCRCGRKATSFGPDDVGVCQHCWLEDWLRDRQESSRRDAK